MAVDAVAGGVTAEEEEPYLYVRKVVVQCEWELVLILHGSGNGRAIHPAQKSTNSSGVSGKNLRP